MTSSLARSLRVLIVEDNDADAELVVAQLMRSGFDPDWRRVQNEHEFIAALHPDLDVVLADFHMPAFGAQRALELLKDRAIDVPLIVVSGSIGEETAVQVLHSGAADYLLKDRLARLGQAVRRVVFERRLQSDKRSAEEALKATEDRTRFALHAAQVGVWEADVRTGAMRWSEILESLHGLAPGTFGGTLQAFLERVHPDDRVDVAKAFEDASRRHADSDVLYRTQWKDGTTRWIHATGKVFHDDGGVPVRAAGIGLDVTERHLLEEQQRQLQKVESIGQLAGGVAHDFNNLLTAIQGYCELLSSDLDPESQQQRDLREIRHAADRAAALTRQLLAFSRRQMLELRVFDLRDSVTGMESMLKRLIGENLTFAVRTCDDYARVKADRGQIEQVIMNLALNARDAMPGGGSLVLDVAVVDLDESQALREAGTGPGRHVMLSVSDTGIGMDATTQARIFEPFFTTKPPGRGTGLGLSTVYGIVKQSGGHISVHSEPGRGSRFNVFFPCVDEAVEQQAAPDAAGSVAGTETILVVEDESGVRGLVRRVLERHGYRVLVAATPGEALALEHAFREPIDLLLTDVVLPEMSGRALADQILTRRPDTPVVFMSGYTDSAIVHEGVLEPDTPFLQKPFTPGALARKIRAVLA